MLFLFFWRWKYHLAARRGSWNDLVLTKRHDGKEGAKELDLAPCCTEDQTKKAVLFYWPPFGWCQWPDGHLKTLLWLEFRPQRDSGSKTHLFWLISFPADPDIEENCRSCIDGGSSILNFLHRVSFIALIIVLLFPLITWQVLLKLLDSLTCFVKDIPFTGKSPKVT